MKEEGRLVAVSPDLRAGSHVRVLVNEPTEEELERRTADLITLLDGIRKRMKDHPEQFRTPEQIDADIKTEREAWG